MQLVQEISWHQTLYETSPYFVAIDMVLEDFCHHEQALYQDTKWIQHTVEARMYPWIHSMVGQLVALH